MKSTELKIKRQTLAAESRLIKREEIKAIRAARHALAVSVLEASATDVSKRLLRLGLTMGQQARIVVRLARNVPGPVIADIGAAYAAYNSLRNHRIKVVRPAARAAHLAHAYLNETDYLRVENPVYTLPPSEALMRDVASNVRKFGDGETSDLKHIADWIGGRPTLAAKLRAKEEAASVQAAE